MIRGPVQASVLRPEKLDKLCSLRTDGGRYLAEMTPELIVIREVDVVVFPDLLEIRDIIRVKIRLIG